MKKVKPLKRTPRQAKKGGKEITTTSVAFKTENLEFLKAHDMHVKDDLSISWIVNRLIVKFRDGGVTLE